PAMTGAPGATPGVGRAGRWMTVGGEDTPITVLRDVCTGGGAAPMIVGSSAFSSTTCRGGALLGLLSSLLIVESTSARRSSRPSPFPQTSSSYTSASKRSRNDSRVIPLHGCMVSHITRRDLHRGAIRNFREAPGAVSGSDPAPWP